MPLSSSEAELSGVVKTAAEVLGVVAMFAHFGFKVPGCAFTDTSAALSILQAS